jgi:hexosaminidase
MILGAAVTAAAEPLPLIPQPVLVQAGEGSFSFSAATAIRYNPQLDAEAKLFAADLGKLTGRETQTVRMDSKGKQSSEILIDLDASLELPPSGYQFEITPTTVRITGKDSAGAYYGTRTLLQLLPADKLSGETAMLPAVKITDYPRFGWRGMMLDVGRHFYPVGDIKRFIDGLAFHKINVFHWHLSEDQGWRIEIKKYPKLTEVGGYRASTPPYGNRNSDDGVRYGGFYTQEQIKEIVAYATARHINIVPEIDMPGHMSAAIAAYPELGNSDIAGYAPSVKTRWGVHYYTLAPTEEVFTFVDDIFTELCALFPSKYIHIGGDEAPKNQWESSPRVKELMKKEGMKNGHDVQSYFVKRIEKILESKGRKLIGWDEIREGGLSPKASVMSWRGEEGGIASAKEGHDVVMAANSFLYFDHYQSPAGQELAKGKEYEGIGGHLPIETVYSYNPVPTVLTPDEAKHVLGVQAQIWTEYIKDYKKVEYFAFPRIAALAEIAWSPLKAKDYAGFCVRLDSVIKHYDAAGIRHGDFSKPAAKQTKDGSTVETSLSTHDKFWPELAFDGRTDTFFWAGRDLKVDDQFSLHFKAAIAKAVTVTVTTGGPASANSDQLEKGVLEASSDGKTWTEIASFENGKASGKLVAGTNYLRLRVTAAQKNWLILREIVIE